MQQNFTFRIQSNLC